MRQLWLVSTDWLETQRILSNLYHLGRQANLSSSYNFKANRRDSTDNNEETNDNR